MRLLITTRCDLNIQQMTNMTHPLIEQYARRVGADFLPLSHATPFQGDGKWHYRIFALNALLMSYDRIVHFDSDMVINPWCPNIFETVPETHVGTIFEDVGSRQASRRMYIGDVQRQWGNVGWTAGYINTGVFVVSRCHRNIFCTNAGQVWNGFGYDDVHLGYMIHKFGHPVYELPFQWNHMTMFSEDWNGNANRFNSYIMHYAGKGVFDKDVDSRNEQIRRDITIINS